MIRQATALDAEKITAFLQPHIETSMFLLSNLDDGDPVGMTSVNARADYGVQIDGVFVRPDCRGQGHAGRMVAVQLAELRDGGIEAALLFAASDAAAQAYTRIGFRRFGDYRIAMLHEPCAPGAVA